MAGRLSEFLERARQTPFAWGRFDCVLWLADWSYAIGAGDPGKAWRGRYDTGFGAGRIVKRAGSMTALVQREFGPKGWARVDEPRDGAIGIVRTLTPVGEGEAGAIRAGSRWALIGSKGLIVGAFPTIACWEHPCLMLSQQQ